MRMGKPWGPPTVLVKTVCDSKQVQKKKYKQIIGGMFSGSGIKRFFSGVKHGGFGDCFEQPERDRG